MASIFRTIARVGTAIVTGGTSELVRLVAPSLAQQAQQLLFPTTPQQLLATASLIAAPTAIGKVLPALTAGVPSNIVSQQYQSGAQWDPNFKTFIPAGYSIVNGSLIAPAQPQAPVGVNPMALNIGGILGQVGTIFGGGQNSIFEGVSNVANLASQFFPTPTMSPAQVPMVVNRPATAVPVRLGAGSITSLTNEVITAGGKLLGTLGIPVRSASSFSGILKRALTSIASLARRTPAGTIVSILAGLGLTAYESNLLVAWHAQRKRGRRMNPANSKALRRAARRIRSFHKLCTHTDVLRTRGRRVGVGARCGTCRKSPCRC